MDNFAALLVFIEGLPDEKRRFVRPERLFAEWITQHTMHQDFDVHLKIILYLEIFVDQHHRAFVSMPPENKVVANREDDDRPIYQTAPIHCRELHRRSQWEESEEVDQQQEEYSDDVATEACAAKTPASVRQRISADLAQRNA